MSPPDGDGRSCSLSRISKAAWLSTALLSGCQGPPQVSVEPVRVAAASDLALAFAELGRLFEARTGQKVTFSFAASGVLTKQLAQGAPYDLFAAANASFAESAVASGACRAGSKTNYARGHLAVWSKRGGVAPAKSLADLADPRFKRIAIANPEHAPYGKAAREALTAAGVWDAVAPRLVYGENVRQALQLAQTGNVEASIVALSLVFDDGSGARLPVDPALHAPLTQTLVVCQHGKNEEGAKLLARLLASPEGQALLQRYGFDPAAP
jgi:molybdate transport system substrate-binding protein